MHGNSDEYKDHARGEGGKKLIETIEWNTVYGPQCEGCKDMYSYKNEEPPCSTCKPEQIESNLQALEIFYLTRNQLIMSMNGPIDIMHDPIYRAMDMHNVDNKKECFYKVLLLAREWIEATRKNNDN